MSVSSVISAPIAYTSVVAVEKLVVGSRSISGAARKKPPRTRCIRPLIHNWYRFRSPPSEIYLEIKFFVIKDL